MKSTLCAAVVAVMLVPRATAGGQDTGTATYKCDHAVVTYSGISKAYAEAIAVTARDARAIAAERYGFDMPETFSITVNLIPKGEHAHLWTNGKDAIYLTLHSEEKLRKPSVSGVYNVYGICHEVGHVAMYRLIPNYSWMKEAMEEAWAFYIGSRIVDDVYAKEGPNLWPDQYDYREEGTARLNSRLAGGAKNGYAVATALWAGLGDIVGDRGFAAIFAAWGKVRVGGDDSDDALRNALLTASLDQRLADWWGKAAPLLVWPQGKSTFVPKAASGPLAGRPTEISYDDGVKEGQVSLGDNGQAAVFEVDGDNYYLTSVRIHGSRYGGAASGMKFHIWLCDESWRPITDFTFPYSSFDVDTFKWVDLEVPATNVPRKFIICAVFGGTSEEGIHVAHDKAGGGRSFMGLPNADPTPFSLLGGDWMIRAVMDTGKIPEAGKPAK